MGYSAMTWPFRNRALSAVDLVALNTGGTRMSSSFRRVSRDDALRHSAVWACLRLRADLVSTMPLDVYRRVDGVQVEMPKPPVLVTPGGDRVRLTEWLYSTQWDLDSCGNTFGIISVRDGVGWPARIDLVASTDVVVQVRDGVVSYKIGGDVYDARSIWHEKQFTTSGVPVGLSPLAYAAMSVNGYLSAQQFAADWFSNSAVPASHLKNTAKVLKPGEGDIVKERFKAAIRAGDVFVSGSDWDYSMLSAKASESQFLDERRFGIGDVCRYLGVPGDMIDAETGSSMTYANITQRNLQLLIMNLNPALRRREDAFSHDLLPAPQYAQFNRGGLLEMDVKSRYEAHQIGIAAGFLDRDEVRELENKPPLTLPNDQKLAQITNELGALVRAGFDPEAAAVALGVEPLKHTGLIPTTIQGPTDPDIAGVI